MRVHRFYVGSELALNEDFWLREPKLLWQWGRVLRFKSGQQIVLFDGAKYERLYKLESISKKEAHLKLVADLKRRLPKREVYLLFSLLKKDKNDWVLQKGTELGVSHFWPLQAERSQKSGFNLERAKKIVVEAAEQCGRGDIPAVREQMPVETAVTGLKDKAQLFIAEQNDEIGQESKTANPCGVMIGPEGGWSDAEKELFKRHKPIHLNLHHFTLRAETASLVAALKLIQ